MANIKFKISGDTPSFNTKIFKINTSTVLKTKVVDYSEIDVVHGGLEQDTDYHIRVYDKAGNMVTGNTRTVAWSGTPSSIIDKTVILGGRVGNLSETTSAIINDGTNRINVSPALSLGETVNINFRVEMKNNYPNEFITNYAAIKCKAHGESNFVTVCTLTSKVSPVPSTFTMNLKYNDVICYDMATTGAANSAPEWGTSALSITASEPVGFNRILGAHELVTQINIEALTTTTEPPPPPPSSVSVYLKPVPVPLGEWHKSKYSKICTEPPLIPGQSFRLCILNTAEAHANSEEIPVTVTGSAYSKLNDVISNEASASVYAATFAPNVCNRTCYGTVCVSYENRNTLYLHSEAISHEDNWAHNHMVSSKTLLTGISNTVGGTFLLGACKVMNTNISVTNGQN